GSPLDQSGSGGGASQFYAIPSYQKNEAKSAGKGQRQVPDVSADADPSTGFHIIFGGHDGQAGGTSAATPLWAATVALINQDLKKKGLREVGFANPALYWMGENAARRSPRCPRRASPTSPSSRRSSRTSPTEAAGPLSSR